MNSSLNFNRISFLLFGLVLMSPIFVTGRFTTEQIDEYGKACNATKEDLDVAKSYSVPTTETGKCLMKCMISKLGMLNEDGTYNKTGTGEGMKKYWPEWSLENINIINDRCYEEAQKVPMDVVATCNYGYTVIACINTQAKLLNKL